MKKLMICSAALMAAVAAMAVDVPSANEIGVTVVKAAAKTTLPVAYEGTDGKSVMLGSYIDTRMLSTDDSVKIWTGTEYKIFYWTGSVWKESQSDTSSGATDAAVPLGSGLVFTPKSASATIRLIGQVPGTFKTTVSKGVSSLVVNPLSTDFTLTDTTRLTPSAGLTVKVVSTGKTLTYNGSKWEVIGLSAPETVTVFGKQYTIVRQTKSDAAEADLKIPSGGTFWLSANEQTSINW